jgi:uncharacterized membrane protein
MNDRHDAPDALWRALSGAGLVQGDMPASPAAAHDGDMPWFVKAMLGVAAWISSLLLLAFVGLLMGDLFHHAGVRAALGLTACAAAGLYFRRDRASVFFDQILFVLALLGQALVISAIFDSPRMNWNSSGLWLALGAFEALIVLVIPYRPNRFAAALTALVALHYAAFFVGVSGLFMPACLAALAVALHRQWQAPRLWPMVALALALAPPLAQDGLPMPFGRHEYAAAFWVYWPLWVERAALIAIWLGVVAALLKQVTAAQPWPPANARVWLLALALAAGTWPVPLALFALAVFMLGFARRDRLLQGIGIAQLLWSVGHYYYALQDTLLFKSLTLAALGAALLLLYAASRGLGRQGETP